MTWTFYEITDKLSYLRTRWEQSTCMLVFIQWNCVQTRLAELLIAGREGLCSHCRNLITPHQRKPYTRASVSTNLRRVLETGGNLTLITVSSAPWASLKRNLCCLILNTWKAERLSVSTLWTKGPLDYISALSDLFFIEKIIYFHYEKFSIW